MTKAEVEPGLKLNSLFLCLVLLLRDRAVTVEKSLRFSEIPFPHMQNRCNDSCPSQGACRKK